MLNGGFGKNQFILYYLHLSFKKEKYLQEAWENLVIYLEVCHWDPQLLSQLLDCGPSTFTVIALPYSKVGKVMYGAPSPQGTPQGTDSIKTTNVLQIKVLPYAPPIRKSEEKLSLVAVYLIVYTRMISIRQWNHPFLWHKWFLWFAFLPVLAGTCWITFPGHASSLRLWLKGILSLMKWFVWKMTVRMVNFYWKDGIRRTKKVRTM